MAKTSQVSLIGNLEPPPILIPKTLPKFSPHITVYWKPFQTQGGEQHYDIMGRVLETSAGLMVRPWWCCRFMTQLILFQLRLILTPGNWVLHPWKSILSKQIALRNLIFQEGGCATACIITGWGREGDRDENLRRKNFYQQFLLEPPLVCLGPAFLTGLQTGAVGSGGAETPPRQPVFSELLIVAR